MANRTALDPAKVLEFVEALESGKYEQTTGVLVNFLYPSEEEFCYCAEGVYAKLFMGWEPIIVPDEWDGARATFRLPNGDERGGFIYGAEWEEDGIFGHDPGIMDMNDGFKMSFKGIARVLRMRYL